MIRTEIQTLDIEAVSLTNDHGQVLEGVNFSIQAGDRIWVHGETSDTYFLRVLAGLEPEIQGVYRLNGLSVYEMTFEEFIPYRLNIGYSFPWGGILNNRTVRDNIMLPFMYHGYSFKQSQQIAMNYIEEFGMQRYWDKRPASIPGAMRKLTCLIRALALEPQVLLLDDPLMALPKEAIRAFRRHFELRLKQNPKLIVVVSGQTQDGFEMDQFRHLKLGSPGLELGDATTGTGAA